MPAFAVRSAQKMKREIRALRRWPTVTPPRQPTPVPGCYRQVTIDVAPDGEFESENKSRCPRAMTAVVATAIVAGTVTAITIEEFYTDVPSPHHTMAPAMLLSEVKIEGARDELGS